MKIRNKILLGVLTTLLLSGMAITAIWYSTSRKLLDTYLENISNSTMLDAYHAFEYLLTDTSYMATLIATNQANIIEPVEYLVTNELKVNNQWNQGYLDNKRTIMNYIGGLNIIFPGLLLLQMGNVFFPPVISFRIRVSCMKKC